MASCSFAGLVVAMLMLVVSLALCVVAILTDYWFIVETRGIVPSRVEKENNYIFGFWRRCYDNVPDNIPSGDIVGTNNDCVNIYEDLIPKSDENVTSDQELVNHMSRSYIGLAITSGAAQLATIITLLCGSWPGGDCKRIQRASLYICSSLILLIATMAGIASGVCFIAARNVEETDMNKYITLDTDYGWSFMLHWISTGLCLINSFIILCMLKYAYNEVNDNAKYYYS